ncbi:MAG: cysteine hydrolase [Acidimicrobiia bacterium]
MTVPIIAATTALMVTDPQNDFLSTKGAFWEAVEQSVTENNTIENIETMFRAAKDGGVPVFVSPHYYYPWDHRWKFAGTIEKAMHDVGMYDRPDPLDLTGFEGSGADFLDQYKPYIHDGETVVANPHKVYGPENNDLLLQLRKRGIDSVYLCGMSANLCTEAHLREMLEQGFEVTVVRDATAAAILPELGDGYAAALTNFRFLANAVVTTEEASLSLRNAKTN